MKKNKGISAKFFNAISTTIIRATNTPAAFLMVSCIILVWGITGRFFHFSDTWQLVSDTWQLVINTGTAIVTFITFLMVFVIQHSPNKDTKTIQLKLNELIAASCDASSRLVNIGELTVKNRMYLENFILAWRILLKSGNALWQLTHFTKQSKTVLIK